MKDFRFCCHPELVSESSKNGFTLIELLVVVLIIGILSAVALPQYQAAVMKARMSEGIEIGRAMLTAQQAYLLATGEYTTDLDSLDLTFDLAQNKNFTSKFLFMDSPSCSLLDLKSKNSSFGDIWIATYFEDGSINCAAAVSSVEGNNFCRKYTSQMRVCPCQPTYNCYQIH